MSTSSTSSLGISGLVSGINTNSIIQQLVAVDSAPIAQLQKQQTNLLNQSDALTAIGTSLKAISADAQALSDPQFFQTVVPTVANASIGTATMDSTVPGIINGNNTINIEQLSTQSTLVGGPATPNTVFNPATHINAAVGSGGLGASVFDPTANNAVFTIGMGDGDNVTVTVSASGVSYTGTVKGQSVSGSTAGYSLNDIVTQVNNAFGSNVMNYVNSSSGGPKVYLSSAGEGTSGNGGSITLSTQSGSFLQTLQLFNAPSQQSSTLPSGTTSTTSLTSLFGEPPSGGYTFSLNGTQINVPATDSGGNPSTIGDLITAVDASASTTGVRAILGTDSSTGMPKIIFQSTNNNPITATDVQGSLISSMQLSALTPFTGAGAQLNIDNPSLIGSRDPSVATNLSGNLTINGVTVAYATTDSLQTVLNNITGSAAGVVATYDSYSDTITLTSKTRGDSAINLSDSGSFLSTYGLASADNPTFTAGSPTVFTVNGGPARVAESSTLSSSELGINGLTFNASAVGSTTVSIAPDVTSVAAAINQLVKDYNSAQTLIQSYIQVDPSNSSDNGVLATDSEVDELPSELRLLMGAAVNDPTNSSYSYRSLADLGVDGNATDNTFTQVDTTDLTDALSNHLGDIQNLFANLVTSSTSTYPTLGLAQSLQNFVTTYATGPNSVISTREEDINTQVQQMNTQIAAIQAQVAAETQALQAEFASYESALAVDKSNEAYFGGTANSVTSTTPTVNASNSSSSSSSSSTSVPSSSTSSSSSTTS